MGFNKRFERILEDGTWRVGKWLIYIIEEIKHFKCAHRFIVLLLNHRYWSRYSIQRRGEGFPWYSICCHIKTIWASIQLLKHRFPGILKMHEHRIYIKEIIFKWSCSRFRKETSITLDSLNRCWISSNTLSNEISHN